MTCIRVQVYIAICSAQVYKSSNTQSYSVFSRDTHHGTQGDESYEGDEGYEGSSHSGQGATLISRHPEC